MNIRLTKQRLQIIIDALAYYETMCDDFLIEFDFHEARGCGDSSGISRSEWNHKRKVCLQAFEWAYQELAERLGFDPRDNPAPVAHRQIKEKGDPDAD